MTPSSESDKWRLRVKNYIIDIDYRGASKQSAPTTLNPRSPSPRSPITVSRLRLPHLEHGNPLIQLSPLVLNLLQLQYPLPLDIQHLSSSTQRFQFRCCMGVWRWDGNREIGVDFRELAVGGCVVLCGCAPG